MPTTIVAPTAALDGSALAAAGSSKYKTTAVVQGETPLQFDVGLLASVDPNPISRSGYKANVDDELCSRARNATQALVNQLFALPTTRHPAHGPLAALPRIATPLPREKPMPKPKPLTKWEKFAKTKGISHVKKDKLVYDEETQTWVPRWGYKGHNKKFEEQWIHEVKAGAEDGANPMKEAAKERKERKLKNESQRLKNEARANNERAREASKGGLGKGAAAVGIAAGRQKRKAELEADVLRSRASTASMGRFDKRLEGESKQKGLKRKFEPSEASTESERATSLALLNKLGRPSPMTTKQKKKGQGDSDLINTRKAVKFATSGSGVNALRRGKK